MTTIKNILITVKEIKGEFKRTTKSGCGELILWQLGSLDTIT